MKIQETLPVSGTLKIDLVYPDRVVNHIHDKNLIVLLSRQNILATLYLSGRVSDPIASLHAGTGGSIDPQAEFPKTVSKNLTSLYTEILSVPTSYSVDNTAPSVTFIADIPEGTANGQLLNEAGLFTTSGNMFNIKTFPGIPKTSEFSIHLEWTIDFS